MLLMRNLLIFEKLSYEISDFSNDVIPLLMGKIYSWHTSKIYMDIGNESSLKKANVCII